MVLYRFDNTFSKNLIEIFNFVFKCHFYFVFSVVFNFLYNDPVWFAFPGRVDEPKTIIFQNEKKTFQIGNFVPLLSVCYQISLI